MANILHALRQLKTPRLKHKMIELYQFAEVLDERRELRGLHYYGEPIEIDGRGRVLGELVEEMLDLPLTVVEL